MVARRSEDLFRFPAGGEGQHNISANDHTEISVYGVDGMHEEGGSSNRTKRGGDFSGDDAALAHAGHDDTATAGIHEFDGVIKGVGHGPGNAVGQGAQRFGFDANDVFTDVLHGEGGWYQNWSRRRVSLSDCHFERGAVLNAAEQQVPRPFGPRNDNMLERNAGNERDTQSETIMRATENQGFQKCSSMTWSFSPSPFAWMARSHGPPCQLSLCFS